MRFALFTALKYLFGRSRLGATGWISLVSAVAICIVTAALVCVLSVYNGYVAMLVSSEADSSPDLLLRPKYGNTLAADSLSSILGSSPYVQHSTPILEAQAVLRSTHSEHATTVYGIRPDYTEVVPMQGNMASGSLLAPERYRADADTIGITIGIALAAEGADASDEDEQALQLILPRREGLINPLVASSAFSTQDVIVTGVLPPYSEAVNKRIYMDAEALAGLLNYDRHTANALAIKLQDAVQADAAQSALSTLIGTGYSLLNREEQQPGLTVLIRTERIMVYLIMIAILILAAFNLGSSLVMLILEKDLDIRTLYTLGATRLQTTAIFAFTGILISSIGSVLGLILGLGISLAQAEWGFLYSGEGLSRMPFPIDIQMLDLGYTLLATAIISAISAALPASILWRRNYHVTIQL